MKKAQFKKLVETLEKCDIEDELKKDLLHTLEDLQNHKQYGLVWNKEKVMEDVVLECEKKMPILESVKGKRIEEGGNSEHNIFIEGDNYHALQVLQQSHQRKIDVIYIDPPYNTGNKDFIYNDKYVKQEDDYRHSMWLSFMEKRLDLAKDLMSDNGVIFISIDDNEQANLKLLCDSILGEKNFIADIIWNSRKSVSSDAIVSLNHNHTLVYARDIDTVREMAKKGLMFKFKAQAEKFTNTDNDPRGPWAADPFDAPDVRSNLTYPIKNPKTGKIFMPPKGRHWRTTKEEYERFFREGRIVFGKNGTSKPQLKRYLSDAEERGRTPKSIWDNVGTTTNGTQELEEILGEKKFNNPKPVKLIKEILLLATKEDGIILDFFAGSGTTGHAVLELNKEDGGNRQFILCTNNENNNGNGHGGVAESVCYPRIKSVIEGYKKGGDGEEVAGLGGGLEYFKTDFVDVNVHALTDKDKLAISKKIGYILGIRHNCFEEKELNDHYHILENKKESVFIYFEEDLSKFKEFKKHMKGKNGVMYSYAGGTRKRYGIDEKDFENIRVEKIPEQFLTVYKNCIS